MRKGALISPLVDWEYLLGGEEPVQKKRSPSRQQFPPLISVRRRAGSEVYRLDTMWHNCEFMGLSVTLLLWWLQPTGACDLEWEHWLLEVSQHDSWRPSSHLDSAKISPPPPYTHKLAGTGAQRLFIVQQRQVGRLGSQAANVDEEQWRDRGTQLRKTWARGGMLHVCYHLNSKRDETAFVLQYIWCCLTNIDKRFYIIT